MGGSPSRSNELLIDRAPDTTGDSRVAYNPPVDAVAEVKAESFQADAAYGHTGGETVNVVLKSGSNLFHGTLYEFNQISNTAATPFFTNKVGGKKPTSRFNQYGGSFSGPVLIPKIVDGRNKLFFFFADGGRVAAQQLDWNRRMFSSRFNDARADGVNQIDFSVIKAFPLKERLNLTYRCESFNLTNMPIFSAPQLAPTNSNFGLITNEANSPRRIQMALRLVF